MAEFYPDAAEDIQVGFWDQESDSGKKRKGLFSFGIGRNRASSACDGTTLAIPEPSRRESSNSSTGGGGGGSVGGHSTGAMDRRTSKLSVELQLAAIHDERDAISGRLTHLEVDLARLTEERDRLSSNSEIRRHRERYLHLNEELTHLTAVYEAHQTEVASLKREIECLRNSTAANDEDRLRAAISAAKSAQKQTVRRKKRQSRVAPQELHLPNSDAMRRAEVANIRIRLENDRAHRVDLEGTLRSLESEMAVYRANAEDHCKGATDLTQLQAENDQLKALVERLASVFD